MRRIGWWCVLAIVSCLMSGIGMKARAAGDPAEADPAKVGVDYDLQGEYVGKNKEGDVWGAQIIAQGDDQFEIVGYKGGLPGEGWSRGDEVKRGNGKASDGVLTIKGDEFTATVKGGVITVKHGEEQVAELTKKVRKSPTLGAKAPQGAIVLFDGTTADNFNNGKIVEIGGEKLLASSNPESKELLNDHTLHIEFRTPYMPKSRGQGRGNSGVYAQGRYEIQVLDSFGLEGADNECGGIYSISKPAVNMCLPPLTWQTYDIDFKAAKYDADGKKTTPARITIKHNGVTIHDNLELKAGTPGHHPEGPDPDHLYLQDHGNPVVFRNIWVVKK